MKLPIFTIHPDFNLQLDQKELQLNQHKKEQKRTNRKFQTQISQERNANTELAERLKEQEVEKVNLLSVEWNKPPHFFRQDLPQVLTTAIFV